MVKITNGKQTIEVTSGAYNDIFRHQGYVPVEAATVPVVEPEHKPEVNEDEAFAAELLEKPISQWNKGEVKKFAELKGIDISGTKNAGEAKELIKAYINEQEAAGAKE